MVQIVQIKSYTLTSKQNKAHIYVGTVIGAITIKSNLPRWGEALPPLPVQSFLLPDTDASTKQLGAVITQDNRPIAFFSWKLSGAQSKYTVTKLELLAIVETLKEFKGILWGQRINFYTDH